VQGSISHLNADCAGAQGVDDVVRRQARVGGPHRAHHAPGLVRGRRFLASHHLAPAIVSQRNLQLPAVLMAGMLLPHGTVAAAWAPTAAKGHTVKQYVMPLHSRRTQHHLADVSPQVVGCTRAGLRGPVFPGHEGVRAPAGGFRGREGGGGGLSLQPTHCSRLCCGGKANICRGIRIAPKKRCQGSPPWHVCSVQAVRRWPRGSSPQAAPPSIVKL